MLAISILILLLGLVLNLPTEACILNLLFTAWTILAYRNPKSKLTSKPRPTYTGRALS